MNWWKYVYVPLAISNCVVGVYKEIAATCLVHAEYCVPYCVFEVFFLSACFEKAE